MSIEARSDGAAAAQAADIPGRVATLARTIAGLAGWRRWLAATLAGVLSILSMAPFFLWPVLFLTLPVLVFLIEGTRRPALALSRTWPGWLSVGRAGLVGWFFALGYHVVGLYWLREAFAVTAGQLEMLWPLAVLGLPAYLAVYTGLATAAVACVPGSVVHRTIALGLALALGEWLRGHCFTGFPWNTIGYALTYPLVLAQSASILGIYGLTLLVPPIFAGPAVVLAVAPTFTRSARPLASALAIALVPMCLLAAFGAVRLATPPPPAVAGSKLRLVQPSVPQRAKWEAARQRELFDRHLDVSRHGPDGHVDDLSGITHVIWPEAAMPFQPLRYPQILDDLGDLLPDGTQLLAGILRTETRPGSDGIAAFNSAAAFDSDGQPTAIYDKIHLVPWGEYLPFQSTLEGIGLSSLTRQRGGFAVGPAPRPLLKLAGLPPLGVLICYEVIFPAAVVQGRERPGALLNLTNDGWFGNSTGPRQHLHQARVRAIEEGLPLLRVANNGISAVFDAYGRELSRLDLDVAGVIDTALPGTISPPIYARLGDGLAALIWLISAVFLAISVSRPMRT